MFSTHGIFRPYTTTVPGIAGINTIHYVRFISPVQTLQVKEIDTWTSILACNMLNDVQTNGEAWKESYQFVVTYFPTTTRHKSTISPKTASTHHTICRVLVASMLSSRERVSAYP